MATASYNYLYVILLCFLINILEVRTLSGGFFADNGREQSVLFAPLARRQRRELQDEILNILGLEHRPRPKHHDMQSSAPKFLLDLYKAYGANDGPQDTRCLTDVNNGSKIAFTDSDVIVSFVNKIHHKAPHLRHEKDRRFWFDVDEIPPEEEIVKAELRIYRELNEDEKQKHRKYTLSLFYLVEENKEKNTLELVDELIITQHESGWLAFNVTNPIMEWIAFPSKNLGLYLKVKDTESLETATPIDVGIIGSKGAEEKQPFMVAYFKTPSHMHVRKRRAAKKRTHESSNDQSTNNPYTGAQDKHPSRRSCQRWTLYVSFRDLGWQDWIIAPDGYAAFYCHGQCSFPLNAHMNATNHAIVQTLVHLMDSSVVPKPCCAPTQLSAITVLYFDDNSNVILKKYKNMVVKSCGCH